MCYGRDELVVYNTPYCVQRMSVLEVKGEGEPGLLLKLTIFPVPTGSPQGPMVPFLPTLDLGCCSQRGLQGSDAQTWEWPSNLPCPKLV